MSDPATTQNRRAAKQFDSNHKMTKKGREKLLSTALISLSSFKIQNWHFVVVDDPEQRKWIREASWDQKQVTDASMLIILCTDLEAWEQEPPHCWHPPPESLREFMVPTIQQYYNGLDPMQRDEVMRSCGIAAEALMLSAQSMGYDACPLDGFDADAVGELINLPEDHAVCMFVAIGKSTGDALPPADELPMEEVVVTDSF
ncbi:MAG: nitroreductase family protein [Verrucomicrobia bacterium]|nr:MAG: nitroreductase family protein [Verrucomicrobiota bacterium]